MMEANTMPAEETGKHLPLKPAQKITTATGSYYVIDNGFWNKNGGSWERVWWAHCIPDTPYASWSAIEMAEHKPIQGGLRMYIGSWDVWWVSTPIVSIEEIASCWDDGLEGNA